jgi:hypothetical protein
MALSLASVIFRHMYLVMLCTSCSRVSLTPADEVRSNLCVCTFCGGKGRITPSCGYATADLGLFAELTEVVADGAISPLEADQLSFQVERSLATQSFEPFFETLSSRLPGFTTIQLHVARNRNAQQRALMMFRSVFDALATRARSGTLPALASPRPLEPKMRTA